MKTTELFNFPFVDRTYERDIINNFFNNKSETTLWIKGASGFGKTTFFNYMYDNWDQYSLCYVNIKIDDTSKDVITNFIFQLQKYSNVDFISQFKKNYKKIYNTMSDNIKNITEQVFPKISNIVSVLLDAGNIVIKNNDKNENNIDIITSFIKEILKNKKLCICIDNFSRCDLRTASFFIQTFKTFLNDENFRSCIITTTEEITEELKEEIYHSLSYSEIRVAEFNDYSYFGQILNSIFDQSNFEKEDLQYIYQKCNGSPQKLSTIITKLLDKGGITISNSQKAIINKNILYSILQEEHIYFTEQDFTPIQQWIIFSYLCLSEEVEIKKVKKCALYISKEFCLFNSYDSEKFDMELTKLLSKRILNLKNNNYIIPYHDRAYREMLDIFNNSTMKSIFHQYTYQFLLNNYPDEKQLLCKNARESNMPKWEIMNFRYGKLLVKNKQYYDAQKIFMYLNNYMAKLNIMQILFIAINSYVTGNYKLAINLLNLFEPKMLRFSKPKFYYYFYLGKSYNNIGNVNKAIEYLEEALTQVEIGSEEYVNTLNILHMYYCEVPQKKDKAYALFKEITDNYKEKFPQIWANTIRGCHNFMNNEDSLKYLFEAETILVDELEKAFIKTTIGFVYIRMDKLEEAKKQFESACEVIKRLKIHEYSYAMNNFAICYMLKGDYQKAKDILLEALLWNRTQYGKLAIYCQLLSCNTNLKRIDEAKDYYKYLDSYIANNTVNDPIVNRKIYLNLAIASQKNDCKIMTGSFLEKAKNYVENSSSEWRYYNLIGAQQKFNKTIPHLKYQCTMDFEPWFLIYAHD